MEDFQNEELTNASIDGLQKLGFRVTGNFATMVTMAFKKKHSSIVVGIDRETGYVDDMTLELAIKTLKEMKKQL